MSWVTELYDLYDRNAEQAGIITENNPVLLPVYHTTVTVSYTHLTLPTIRLV